MRIRLNKYLVIINLKGVKVINKPTKRLADEMMDYYYKNYEKIRDKYPK
jgi:hypothetical protein